MTLPEYIVWAQTNLGVDFDGPEIQRRFRINQSNILNTVNAEPFFGDLGKTLETLATEYQAGGYALLMGPNKDIKIDWDQKTWDSVVNKTLRLNRIWNRQWPKAPRDLGWIAESNLYERIDDLIRTTIVSKYLDGEQFIAERLCQIARTAGLDAEVDSREADHGYYAHHLLVKLPVDIMSATSSNPASVLVTVEIQITTQFQEALYNLTHPIYEARRLDLAPDRKHWKWNPDALQFDAGYAAHTLHWIEGLLLRLKRTIGSPPVRDVPGQAARGAPDAASTPDEMLGSPVPNGSLSEDHGASGPPSAEGSNVGK